MKGLQVKCPNCKKIMHFTSELFNPNVRCNGSMVHLINPWRKWGWPSFGGAGDGRLPKHAEVKGTLASDMICPSCTMPLAPSGHLTVLNLDGSPFVPLPPESYKGDPNVRVYDDGELEREWDLRVEAVRDEAAKFITDTWNKTHEGQNLKTRDQLILDMIAQDKTQAQIADKIGVSRGRVSQIVKRLNNAT